jgi:hypothetical protein
MRIAEVDREKVASLGQRAAEQEKGRRGEQELRPRGCGLLPARGAGAGPPLPGGRRADEMCPPSKEGGTRLVQLVRGSTGGRGEGGGFWGGAGRIAGWRVIRGTRRRRGPPESRGARGKVLRNTWYVST